MFQRRSTLDPVEKQRRNKQTEFFSIIDKCLQIPSDDKLMLRNMIKNQHEETINLLMKYRKNKNLAQLQTALRKTVHREKLQDSNKIWAPFPKQRHSQEKQPKNRQKSKGKQSNDKQSRRLSDQHWALGLIQRKKIATSQGSDNNSLKPDQFIPHNAFPDVPFITIEVTKSIKQEDSVEICPQQLQKQIQHEIQHQINKQLDNLNDLTINFKDITMREDDRSIYLEQYQLNFNSQNQQYSRFLGNQPMPTFGCEDISRVNDTQSISVSEKTNKINILNQLNDRYGMKKLLNKKQTEKKQCFKNSYLDCHENGQISNKKESNRKNISKTKTHNIILNKQQICPEMFIKAKDKLQNIRNQSSILNCSKRLENIFDQDVEKYVTLGTQDIQQIYTNRVPKYQNTYQNQKIPYANSRTIVKQPNIQSFNTFSYRSKSRNALTQQIMRNRPLLTQNNLNSNKLQISKRIIFDDYCYYEAQNNGVGQFSNRFGKKTTEIKQNEQKSYKFGQFYKRIKMTVDGTLD